MGRRRRATVEAFGRDIAEPIDSFSVVVAHESHRFLSGASSSLSVTSRFGDVVIAADAGSLLPLRGHQLGFAFAF